MYLCAFQEDTTLFREVFQGGLGRLIKLVRQESVRENIIHVLSQDLLSIICIYVHFRKILPYLGRYFREVQGGEKKVKNMKRNCLMREPQGSDHKSSSVLLSEAQFQRQQVASFELQGIFNSFFWKNLVARVQTYAEHFDRLYY